MSRETMIAAARDLPTPDIYGIGSCRVGRDYLDFEIGWPEFERDTDWAEATLRAAGLRAGDMIIITVANWEGPWAGPLVRALRRIGVTYMTVEVYGWDARRFSMFLSRFPVKAILGMGGESTTALLAAEPPLAELLDRVEFVWARPDAVAQLSGLTPQVADFVFLGPALGLGLPGQPGARINHREWAVEEADGQLVVSNVAMRATAFSRFPTGIRGTVETADSETVLVRLRDEPPS